MGESEALVVARVVVERWSSLEDTLAMVSLELFIFGAHELGLTVFHVVLDSV